MISNAARVSAFGDDALGALDATAVAEALRSGAVSRVEVVDAAIARTQLVNPGSTGWPTRPSTGPAPARRPRPVTAGSSTGCRPSSRTTSRWRACRRWRVPTPGARARRRRTANSPAPTCRRVSSRSARRRCRNSASVPSPSTRVLAPCATLEHRPHRRCVVVGIRRVRRGGRRPDRACQRRRRFDSDSGVVQRAGRTQALARPAAP